MKDRRVEVFSFTTNYVQIWAYDLESNSNKLFKTNRIDSVEILEDDWQNAEQHHAGFIDVFRMSTFEQMDVSLKMGLRASSLLLEEYPLAEKDLTKISNNEFVLNTKVCGFAGVGRFVLGLLDDIEIVYPQEFKDYIKEKLIKYQKKL
ncbi:hypothetical protein FACS1894178_7910 [Bacteroidia bacterium]|nr:hypothetical protein FACS1894178_7910 [Bacteroidia bacterium]